AAHAQHERIIARHEPAIEADVPRLVLGTRTGVTAGDALVERQRLHPRRTGVADDADAARPRRIPLDVPLGRERLEQVRDGLRGLDPKLLADLADARLVRVLREKVEEEVVDLPLDRREGLRHWGLLSNVRTPDT